MQQRDTPNRELQALAEVGRTRVARGTAAALLAAFLLTVGLVPLVQAVFDWRRGTPGDSSLARFSPPLAVLARGVAEARAVDESGTSAALGAANSRLLAAIAASEEALEDGSFLRTRWLPYLQAWQTNVLGLGNEQAYVGRDGWLFYRADVDYVTGPGFLAPQVLARRARGGAQWRAAPVPDPLPALAAFARDLAGRGARLLVVPTPVKPQIHPDALSYRSRVVDIPLRNPSFDVFVAAAREHGIEIFDPAPILAAGARRGEAQYLATDTHWTPAAVERVAAALAVAVGDETDAAPPVRYLRRAVVVEGAGDIARMLTLPARSGLAQPEELRARRVLEADGTQWRPDDSSRVLVLGDSFTNVYSDPGLGWGTGAGLAEQLSYELGRPVARLAMNAGGADGLRAAFERQASRFDNLSVVVYQFAARDLAQGNWRTLPASFDD